MNSSIMVKVKYLCYYILLNFNQHMMVNFFSKVLLFVLCLKENVDEEW